MVKGNNLIVSILCCENYVVVSKRRLKFKRIYLYVIFSYSRYLQI